MAPLLGGHEVFMAGIVLAAVSLFLMCRFFQLRQFWRPGVIHWLYGFHMTAQWMPGIFFFFESERTAGAPFFLAMSLAAVLIPLGGVAVAYIFPHTRQIDALSSPKDKGIGAEKDMTAFFPLLFAAVFVTIGFYVQAVPKSPLIDLLQGHSAVSVMQSRLAASDAGYVYGLARIFMMPFAFIFCLMAWRRKQGFVVSLALATVMAATLAYNGYNTEKMPVAMIFLLGLMCFVYKADFTRKGINWRYLWPILLLVVLILAYPVLVFLFTPNVVGKGFFYLFKVGIFDRIFLRPAVNAYYAFELFPHFYPYTCFQDVVKLANVMDWPVFRLPQEVAMYKYGISMNAPPPSVGNFYAQAGWLGVVLGTVAAAFIFRLLEAFLLSRPRQTAIEFCLYMMLLYGAFRFSWSNFHNIFLTETIVPVLFVLAFAKLIRKWFPASKPSET